MYKDIENIRALCKKDPLGKKILLVPSVNMKGQIVKTLNDSGVFPFNMEIMTVGMLAFSVAEEYIIKNDLTFLNSNSCIDIVRDVMVDMKEENKPEYFGRLENTYGFNKLIASTIQEIKYGGLSRGLIDFSLIKDAAKRKDIKNILSRYEKELKTLNFIDESDIIDIAADELDKKEDVFLNITSIESCRFSYTETLFLKKLGFCPPSFDEELLHYENASAHLKEAVFKRAYGDACEVKDVLRTIINNKIPFDKVAVTALSEEPYTQLLYEYICTYTYQREDLGYIEELPVTFGCGLPLTLSNPAKLLLSFINWIRGGYAAHDFVNIFSGGAIDINFDYKGDKIDEKNSFGRMTVINIIKSCDLKWQRNTYLPTFKSFKEDLEKRTGIKDSKKLNAVNWLIDMLENLIFPNIPQIDDDGKIDVDLFVDGLKVLVNRLFKTTSAFDTQGIGSVNEELNTVIKGRKVPVEEISSIITEHISSLKIMAESPREGKIHFSVYRGAEWVNRDYTFLIGMDVGRFPYLAVQNPILLDEERCETLRKSHEFIDDNICDMSRLLKNLRGNITVSYSYFNTSEDRENYPSTIYNSLVKNVSHNKGIPEFDFWKNNIETVNIALDKTCDYIDETDCILSQSLSGFKYEEEKHSSQRPFYADTEKCRDLADPRNEKMVISASALGTYYECPYRYYLQYILGLKQISSKELDTLGWLSYFEIGHLYHEIFEKFENEVITTPEILSSDAAAVEKIFKITYDTIEKYEKELPVASEYHTYRQKEEILQNVERFALQEVQKKNKLKPFALEYEFGKTRPCFICLPGGKRFLANGFVDRIDMTSEGKIKITDYKTGSTYGYDILDENRGELNAKSAQPVLYYLALKAISRNAENEKEEMLGNIDSAEYYFVTAKGDYEKYIIKFDETSEQKYLDDFNRLFDSMLEGEFTANNQNCKFCPYSAACIYRGGI